MKKSIKSLKLNKKSISNLDNNNEKINGGRTADCDTDGTYNCGASWITRCDWSVCYCL